MKNLLLMIIVLVFSNISFAKTKVVAIVGSKKITLQEFKKKYKQTESMFNRPSPELFLEDLVRFEIGAQEAERRNYQKKPIIQQIMRQEIYKLLLENELSKATKKIRVTEKEMKKEYKNSPEIKTSHILVELKPNANKKERGIALKRAKEILKEVLASKKDFSDLVRLYSDDSFSKPAGGNIGYRSRVTQFPPYYKAALKTKVGKIYRGLIETQYGFHIIKVTGRNSYQNADKKQLQAIVFDKKRKKIFDHFFVKLKKGFKIKLNKQNLKNL